MRVPYFDRVMTIESKQLICTIKNNGPCCNDCPKSGTSFTPFFYHNRDMRSIYKKQRGFYRKAYESGVHGWPTDKPTHEVMKYLKRIRKNGVGNALDIGCGEGRHSILLAKLGYKVTAIDYEPLAIRNAKKYAAKAGVQKRIQFIVMDGMKPNLKENFFDVVVDYGFFHHVVKEDNSIYKKNILRFLKSNGYLILSVFSTKYKHFEGEKRTRNFLVHRNHYDRFFTREDIRNFARNNFKIIQIVEEHKGLVGLFHSLLQKTDYTSPKGEARSRGAAD